MTPLERAAWLCCRWELCYVNKMFYSDSAFDVDRNVISKIRKQYKISAHFLVKSFARTSVFVCVFFAVFCCQQIIPYIWMKPFTHCSVLIARCVSSRLSVNLRRRLFPSFRRPACACLLDDLRMPESAVLGVDLLSDRGEGWCGTGTGRVGTGTGAGVWSVFLFRTFHLLALVNTSPQSDYHWV